MDGPLSPAATLRHSSRLAGDRATGAVTPSRRSRTGERKGERRPSRGARAPGSLPETVTLLRGGLLVVVQLGPIVVHLAAVAIVRVEVAPIGPELAAVTVDVVLIVVDVLPGAPQIGPVLLHRGHVARRPVLLELLLVLAHGLVIAVTVLPDISIVLPHVLAVLAQVALVTPELTAALLHLRVGRQGRRLPVHARRPGGHCERSEHCHCLPSAHVFLRDWDAVHLVRRGAADGRLPGGIASDEPQECAS